MVRYECIACNCVFEDKEIIIIHDVIMNKAYCEVCYNGRDE